MRKRILFHVVRSGTDTRKGWKLVMTEDFSIFCFLLGKSFLGFLLGKSFLGFLPIKIISGKELHLHTYVWGVSNMCMWFLKGHTPWHFGQVVFVIYSSNDISISEQHFQYHLVSAFLAVSADKATLCPEIAPVQACKGCPGFLLHLSLLLHF